ncbi:MAG: hypothetical protein II332_05025 [Kiritimatiellae bacterium]|nr:hypothetical protein [Kiritimatiellia bacterium]
MLCALALAGCVTTDATSKDMDSDKVGISTIVQIPESQIKSEAKKDTFIEQDINVRLIYKKSGIEEFTISSEADIRDVQAFLITFYKRALKPKLIKGETLNQGELDVLQIILDFQSVVLHSFSFCAYSELMGNEVITPKTKEIKTRPKTSDIIINETVAGVAVGAVDVVGVGTYYDLQTYKKMDVYDAERNTDHLDVFKTQIENFYNNNNNLSKKIKLWTTYSKKYNTKEIFENMHSPYDGEKFIKSLDLNRIIDEQTPMPIRDQAVCWSTLAESLNFYTRDMRDLNTDISKCIMLTVDSYNRTMLEDLRMNYADKCKIAFYNFRDIFYAYPFIVACNELAAEVNDARTWVPFANNKQAMIDSAMKFCELTSVRGNDMVKNLSNSYAAKAYADTLKFLKNKAGERAFQEILNKCQLWSLDESEFNTDDEVFGERDLKRMK